MPRIQRFQDRYPGISLMLNPTAEVVELKPGGVDLAIRHTRRRVLSKSAKPLFVSDMVIIGASSLLGSREIEDPELLADLPWLQELGTNEVADWFDHRGVKLKRPLKVNEMPGNLIMQAVRRGDGIACSTRAFFESEIRSGQMKVLFSEPASGTYYIATGPGPLRSSVKAVVSWLMHEAGNHAAWESQP